MERILLDIARMDRTYKDSNKGGIYYMAQKVKNMEAGKSTWP